MENIGKQRWKTAKLAYCGAFALLACACLVRSLHTAALRGRYTVTDSSAMIDRGVVLMCAAACLTLALLGFASLFLHFRSVLARWLALGLGAALGCCTAGFTVAMLATSLRYYAELRLGTPYYTGFG